MLGVRLSLTEFDRRCHGDHNGKVWFAHNPDGADHKTNGIICGFTVAIMCIGIDADPLRFCGQCASVQIVGHVLCRAHNDPCLATHGLREGRHSLAHHSFFRRKFWERVIWRGSGPRGTLGFHRWPDPSFIKATAFANMALSRTRQNSSLVTFVDIQQP